jgi:hypothetical protein
VHVIATIKNMVGHISASHCGRARFCGVPSEKYGDAELLVALSTDQGSGKRRGVRRDCYTTPSKNRKSRAVLSPSSLSA